MRRVARIAGFALVTGLVSLALATSASATIYLVNSTANEPALDVGATGCISAAAKCTLRGAIEATNADVGVADGIWFASSAFGSDVDGTIDISGGFPAITDPLKIEGGHCTSQPGVDRPCVALDGAPGLDVASSGVTIEDVAVTGAQTAVAVHASSDDFKLIDSWVGRQLDGTPKPNQNNVVITGNKATLRENLIEGGAFGVTFNAVAAEGLVEGNTVRGTSNNSLQVAGSSNEIVGNTIEGSGFSTIFLTGAATDNQIGGNTPASENVLKGSTYSPIAMVVGETTQNEVARNRGSGNGGSFIRIGKSVSADPNFPNGGIEPPPIATALQSSAAGTAEAGTKIRVFRKATDQAGEIASFLGEAIADDQGNWMVKFATQVSVGTNLAATQTNTSGGTSELAFAAAAADPAPPCTVSCGSSPLPSPPPDTTKPKVTIKKGPKAKSTATTAKYVFSSDEAGSKFKCKLDKRAFANCKSPRTYKNLKPGKHVFKVKATDSAGNVSAVVTRKFTVLE